MLFKEYKEKLYLREIEEIILNKKINVRGEEVLILGLIRDDGKNKLWVLKNTKDSDFHESYSETNREKFREDIKRRGQNKDIFILHMHIGKRKMNFLEREIISMSDANAMEIEIIKHFMECGLIGKEWDNVAIEDMKFHVYEENKKGNLPVIGFNKKNKVQIKIEEELKEKLIEQPIKLKIYEKEKKKKIFYEDEEGAQDFFYLNKVTSYDIWEDTMNKIDKNIEFMDENHRENYRKELLENLASFCPRDRKTVALYYKTRDNGQLKFYTKEYLEMSSRECSDFSTIIFIDRDDDKEEGSKVEVLRNGYEDSHLTLEIELFSKYEVLKEEIISFEL